MKVKSSTRFEFRCDTELLKLVKDYAAATHQSVSKAVQELLWVGAGVAVPPRPKDWRSASTEAFTGLCSNCGGQVARGQCVICNQRSKT